MQHASGLIKEGELIIPVLKFLYSSERGILNISELSKMLRKYLNPQGEDIVILKGRNDDKFSQKVRNLRSHKTLKDYVEYLPKGNIKITEVGCIFLNNIIINQLNKG